MLFPAVAALALTASVLATMGPLLTGAGSPLSAELHVRLPFAFAGHPAPLVSMLAAGPEPRVWMMLFSGLALVRLGLRRRTAATA